MEGEGSRDGLNSEGRGCSERLMTVELQREKREQKKNEGKMERKGMKNNFPFRH